VSAPAVSRGIDSDRFETFLMTRTDDSEGNLATVGDENALYGPGRGARLVCLLLERRGITLESDLSGFPIVPVLYGRHASGGASPNTRLKLLQRMVL
jgi:hypothetical protein